MLNPGLGSYGYGWVIERINGTKVVWHNGSFLGYTGILLRAPAKDISIVWLRNQEGNPEENEQLKDNILQILTTK